MATCATLTDDEVNLLDDDSSENDTDKENCSPQGKGQKRRRPLGMQGKSDEDRISTPKAVNVAAKRQLIPLLSMTSILCCQWLCLSMVAVREAEICRRTFVSLDITQQSQWVLDFMKMHSTRTKDGYQYSFVVGSAKVCCLAWRLILGLTQSRFYRIKKQFEDGVVNVSPPGVKRLQYKSVATQHALSWLKEFVQQYADKLPMQDHLHLPSCLTKTDVFSTYCMDMKEIDVDVISQAHFYRIWKSHFAHVRIPKVNRFAKCDKCTLLKTILQQTQDKSKRLAIQERRQKHLRKQNEERRKYYKHSDKARKHPSKYMSIIIDGMDQSKTCVPHFINMSKTVSSSWSLKTHLTGVLVHGHSPYAFFDYFQWPHSSNLTITILLNILHMYKDNLPPVLYLQMDNCGRENKNRFVFAFLCLLVQNDIFRKIKVSFLMVGHTHEDVDQMFSRFSVWLGKHPAITLDELISGFEQCYKPRPTGIKLEKVYNFSHWVTPFINSMEMHSKPHVFKITKNENGKAKLQTKKWSTDPKWQECEGSENGVLLKETQGAPKLCRPTYDLELHRLKGDIGASYRFMKTEDRRWWDEWFAEVDDAIEALSDFDSSDEENWFLPKLQQCSASSANFPSSTMTTDYTDVSDEDAPIRPVRIGGRPRNIQLGNETPIAVGHMCLLDMPKYADNWPQIAQVMSIEEERITVRWFKGSIQSKITPWILVRQGSGRTDWLETVSRRVIWCHGFELTNKGYLSSGVRKLITDYEDI